MFGLNWTSFNNIDREFQKWRFQDTVSFEISKSINLELFFWKSQNFCKICPFYNSVLTCEHFSWTHRRNMMSFTVRSKCTIVAIFGERFLNILINVIFVEHTLSKLSLNTHLKFAKIFDKNSKFEILDFERSKKCPWHNNFF